MHSRVRRVPEDHSGNGRRGPFWRPPFFMKTSKALWVWILVLVLPAPRISFGESATPGALYEEARAMRERGDFLEAERRLASALGQDPSNPDYYFEWANLYAERHDRLYQEKHHEEAKQMLHEAGIKLEQALMLKPDDVAALYNLGVVTKRMERYEEAREAFRRILAHPLAEENPYLRINAWMQIGSTYEEQGFFDEAEDAYRKARDLDVTSTEVEAAMGDLEQAREEYRIRELRRSQIDRMNRLSSEGLATPFSHAAQYAAARNADRESGAGLQQVLPYLGAVLVEQFMRHRTTRNSQGT